MTNKDGTTERQWVTAEFWEVYATTQTRATVQQALLKASDDNALGPVQFISYGKFRGKPTVREDVIKKQDDYVRCMKLIPIDNIPNVVMKSQCHFAMNHYNIRPMAGTGTAGRTGTEEEQADGDAGGQDGHQNVEKDYYSQNPTKLTLYRFLFNKQSSNGDSLFNEIYPTHETQKYGIWNLVVAETNIQEAREFLDNYLNQAVNSCEAVHRVLNPERMDREAEYVQSRMDQLADGLPDMPLEFVRPDPMHDNTTPDMLPADAPRSRRQYTAQSHEYARNVQARERIER